LVIYLFIDFTFLVALSNFNKGLLCLVFKIVETLLSNIVCETWSPKVESKVLVLGIDNVIHDALATIVRAELYKVLTNHDQVDRHEH
jgi:hypothetical protein